MDSLFYLNSFDRPHQSHYIWEARRRNAWRELVQNWHADQLLHIVRFVEIQEMKISANFAFEGRCPERRGTHGRIRELHKFECPFPRMLEVVQHAESPCLQVFHSIILEFLTRRSKLRDGSDIETLEQYVKNNPVRNEHTILR